MHPSHYNQAQLLPLQRQLVHQQRPDSHCVRAAAALEQQLRQQLAHYPGMELDRDTHLTPWVLDIHHRPSGSRIQLSCRHDHILLYRWRGETVAAQFQYNDPQLHRSVRQGVVNLFTTIGAII